MVVEEFWLIPLRGNSGESRYEGILANPATREFWRIPLRGNSGESDYEIS